MAMLIPEAWASNEHMNPDKKAFYEYHASLMEPWDGPAAMAFTDGRVIGATLDRNGLRPARYLVTHDGLVIMASETGVLPVKPEDVKHEGPPAARQDVPGGYGRRPHRLRQGDQAAPLQPPAVCAMAARETRFPSTACRRRRACTRPITRPSSCGSAPSATPTKTCASSCCPWRPTARSPIGSMGTDTPLACLSDRPQPLFHYFKQLFAQVTNPPIDPIREEMVMSLISYIGRERNILDETPQHCHTLKHGASHPHQSRSGKAAPRLAGRFPGHDAADAVSGRRW